MTLLPTPPRGDGADVVAWVQHHLGHLAAEDEVVASGRFRGGQTAADAALAGCDITGYAARRNEVWPPDRRGASALSPYIRHGFVSLPALWQHVVDTPPRDRSKFRDELLWQEYARHWYARLGGRTSEPMQQRLATTGATHGWPDGMACLDGVVDELKRDGWAVNQTRMWLASHWSLRDGVDWRRGEDEMFRHLLDGSRAANRLGWQWASGAGSGRPYGFSRQQVEKRAKGVCASCELRTACPIEQWPDDVETISVPTPHLVTHDPDLASTAGPEEVETHGSADSVWLTAESLGSDDPALAAHPDLPAMFVFDEPLLTGLRLSGKRLVFLAEALAEIGADRSLEIHLGRPEDVLADRRPATTFAPVPGWRRLSRQLDLAAVYPWPWLHRPHDKSIRSFSAWRRALG